MESWREDLWKRVFLRCRHCPALTDQCNWKTELARRDGWSRSWRQLVTTGLRRRRARLPRFIVKLLSGLPAPVLTHIVDPTDARCFSTISSALACARPFDRVLVRPGHYSERLTLEKTVQIIGLGKIGSTVVEGIDGPTVEVRLRMLCFCGPVRGRVGHSSGKMLWRSLLGVPLLRVPLLRAHSSISTPVRRAFPPPRLLQDAGQREGALCAPGARVQSDGHHHHDRPHHVRLDTAPPVDQPARRQAEALGRALQRRR